MNEKFELRLWQAGELVKEYGEPKWIVDGLLLEGTQTMVYAPTGWGKSFAAVDVGCHVATGTSFHGLAVTQGPVIYVAAEAPLEIEKRIMAWERYHDKKTHNLRLVDFPVQLANKEHMEALTEAIKTMGASLVIFDTAERVSYGTDENLPTEVNQKVNAPLDALIKSTGVTTMLVHHAGVNGTRPRGCTAWETPNDTLIKVNTQFALKKNRNQPEIITINVEKQRGTDPISISLGTQRIPFRDGKSTLVLVDSLPSIRTVARTTTEPQQKEPTKKDKLAGLLSEGSFTLQAIATDLYGGNTQVAKNDLQKLKKEGLAISDGKGLWSGIQ